MNKNDAISLIQKHFKALGCSLNKDNDLNYTILNYREVSWNKGRTKLGKLHIQKNAIKLDLDFPVNSFSLEDLEELVDLPYAYKPAKATGSYLNCSIDKDKYDTLRVRIIDEDLSEFDFNGEKFKLLLQLIVSANN